MTKQFNSNGRILFEGKSNIDNKDIVVIITGLDNKTSNKKTGDMLQTWILLRDHKPNEAHKNGLNKSVCGNCPHAGYNNNSCYVKWFQAPLQVWKSYKNNRYDYFKKSDLNSIKIPFVREILNISGVELVLISDNFLTVKKEKNTSWDSLKPMIISHLNDFFEKNSNPILVNSKSEKKLDDNDTISKIKDVLDTKIRPAVAKDGGDIKFKSFDNGIVKVELQGACSGCPSSIMTLKQGVQNLLKHYVKEVNSVEAI